MNLYEVELKNVMDEIVMLYLIEMTVYVEKIDDEIVYYIDVIYFVVEISIDCDFYDEIGVEIWRYEIMTNQQIIVFF
jgi:hypothetical protein